MQISGKIQDRFIVEILGKYKFCYDEINWISKIITKHVVES
jgi:hypothetical protein